MDLPCRVIFLHDTEGVVTGMADGRTKAGKWELTYFWLVCFWLHRSPWNNQGRIRILVGWKGWGPACAAESQMLMCSNLTSRLKMQIMNIYITHILLLSLQTIYSLGLSSSITQYLVPAHVFCTLILGKNIPQGKWNLDRLLGKKKISQFIT